MAKFNIAVARPDGYIHSQCFRELGEGLQAGLRRLGHTASLGENVMLPDAINIVLGIHLLREPVAMGLDPLTTIIYNLEQLGGSWTPPWYMNLAQRYQVWDYSPLNLRLWQGVRRCCEPQLVEVGYVPELTRGFHATVQEIDVFFYGSLNERRLQLLETIGKAGMVLRCGFELYGQQRDTVIANSKLVLNLHAHATELFEVVRVSYLLANAKAVVSENSPDIGYLAEAVALATPDNIVDVCLDLLRNDAKRHALEQRGFQVFSQHSLLPGLQAAIAAFPQAVDFLM